MRSRLKVTYPKPNIFWLAVTLIILIAFFFRFYRLDDHPLGLTFDPAINGLDAVRLIQRGGDLPVFFPTNGGREPLHVYTLIPAIWLFKTTPFAIRVVTATLSLFSVVFLFVFLYNSPPFFRSRWPNPPETVGTTNPATAGAPYHFWLAALGSLTLATSYWPIMTGRLGLRTELATFLSIPIIWLFLKGWGKGQRHWFILSGLLLGLLGYTYSAARLLPLILALALVPEFLPPQKGRRIKAQITNLFIFTVAAIIVYLPMMWYLSTHPAQFTARAFSVMIWNFVDTPADIITEVGRNALRVISFFCCVGSPNPIFGLPEYPGLHPILFPFLLIGLLGAIINWRLLFPRLVVLWWLIGLVPSIVTLEAPHPLRMVLAIVPTAILIGLGPIYIVQWLTSKKPNLIPNRLLLLAIPFILYPVFDNTLAYFSDWTKLQATRGAFDYGAVAIRDTVLEEIEKDVPIYLPLARLNFPTLLFYLSGHFQREANLSAHASNAAVVISPDKNTGDTTWVRLHNNRATILPPLTTKGQHLIQEALAGNTTPIRSTDGEVVARLTQLSIDPVQFVETPAYSLNASFGPVNLMGANYVPLIDPPATEIPVTLFWEATTHMTTEYDVLVRLVDDNRRVWGNGDGRPTDWVYPTTFWRPGVDRVAAQHLINLESNGPEPGRYWLAVSIFDPPTGQRLPLTTGNSDSPDTFFIGPLKVPLPVAASTDIERTSSIEPFKFGEMIQLMGFTVGNAEVEPGESLQLSLLWHTSAVPKMDYTVFVHLLDPDGNLVAGNDSQPVGGSYPTSIWTPDEQILDKHILTTPIDLPPGKYRLAIGLYHQPSGQRLPIYLSDETTIQDGRVILNQEITIR
ncbi:MAG: hypothetical protein GY796_10275 [Chloroflexi bacterium]|nr:hypothetical protein [Chloroflexota bacterium]